MKGGLDLHQRGRDRPSAQAVIEALQLEPLPHEGGWFRRYRDGPVTADGRRSFAAIHALFTAEQFSAWHQLEVEEIWCFHAGDLAEHWQLGPDGRVTRDLLGSATSGGATLQTVVPSGVWQGCRLADGGEWTLFSCITVPAFTWAGFRLGAANLLASAYPGHQEIIHRLSRA